VPIKIQSYREEHEAAVAKFNRRLTQSSGDPDLVFSEKAKPQWLPESVGAPVWNEFFLAVEDSCVRGAYGLKQEELFIRNKGIHRVACYHHSLSEGIVDRTYASVGALLVRDALARQPLLYVLGMGGFENPLPKMLRALGFSLTLLPFYFRVVHPNTFLREMKALRSTLWRAILMNVAAATGTGWLAIKGAQATAGLRGRPGNFMVDEIDEFSGWADDLWSEAKVSVSMAAVRDANTLRVLYPEDDSFLTRVRVTRDRTPIGWAIVGERRKDASKFGAMRVGSIVDCWGAPQHALPVVRAATKALEKRGVDLIVSNQSHSAWCRALENSGFLKGPSTFIFAASKKLTELLKPLEENKACLHITRADGDGLPRNF
jgi:hypothetical protein